MVDEHGVSEPVGVSGQGAPRRSREPPAAALRETARPPVHRVPSPRPAVARRDHHRARRRPLNGLGVRLRIDDVGTGCTSISRLQHLTADVLEIDRSSVDASAGSGRELLGLIVRAAHAVGLEVVAEGVEEQAPGPAIAGQAATAAAFPGPCDEPGLSRPA